jgi:hypothetical protein
MEFCPTMTITDSHPRGLKFQELAEFTIVAGWSS